MTENQSIVKQQLIHHLFNYHDKSYSVKYQKTSICNLNYELIIQDKINNKLTIETPPKVLTDRNVIIIDSIYSGIGKEKNYYQNVLKLLLDIFQIKHEYFKTISKNSIKEFAKLNISSKNLKYTIIFLSGDTSICEFFNNIPKKHDIQLGLIPLGSGNSMAHSSKIQDEFHALQVIFIDSPAIKLPIYKVIFPNESLEILNENKKNVKELYFAIIVSWATHSQIVYNAERPELKPLGIDRFKIVFEELLKTNLQYATTLIDLKTGFNLSNSKYFNYLNIISTPEIEKGYLISPDSKIIENKLHMIGISGVSNKELAQLMVLPYKNGTHIQHPAVIYKGLENGIIIKLEEDHNERSNFCVDGIIIQVQNPKGKEVIVEKIPDDRFNIKIIGMKS